MKHTIIQKAVVGFVVAALLTGSMRPYILSL